VQPLRTVSTAALIALVLAAIAGLAAPAPAGAQDGGLLWRGDFDTCDFSQWQSVQRTVDARAQITRSSASSGGCSARIETQPQDWFAGGQRTELAARAGPDYPDSQEGAERYYGWSVLFRSGEFPIYLPGSGHGYDQRRNIIMQLKRAGTGPPPLSLAVDGESWRLNSASCDNKRQKALFSSMAACRPAHQELAEPQRGLCRALAQRTARPPANRRGDDARRGSRA
jgi:hypothetical protein